MFKTSERSSTECNSHETHNIYPNLLDRQQFMLNKINEFKDYFLAEIKERLIMTKRHIILFILFFFTVLTSN